MKRTRMIFDVDPEVRMAIKLHAVKNNKTTGEVVAQAIRETFPDEVKEAQEVLKGGDAT